MVDLMEYAILGIVQGLTEFLPISSTGHLVLFGKLFGLREAGLLFDILLHFGTLLAVVAAFWPEVRQVVAQPTGRLARLLLVGTIPTAAVGLLFEDAFERLSSTGESIGFEFVVTGVILWAVESMPKGTRPFERITYIDALWIGALQGAAILPAVSRSGLTIAGALLRGIERGDAARFSFLLSLPAIAGATVLALVKLQEQAVESVALAPMLLGAAFAALAGYAAIRWMVRLVSSGSLRGFAVYVWLLGGAILAAQALGWW